MKMNKTKIIVPALALAMGAALAGSVSGTVAWFQYSTRAQASYIGSSAHCSEMLEVKAVGDKSGSEETEWSSELDATDIAGVLSDTNGNKLAPISTGAMAQNEALPKIGGEGADKNNPKFYKNPVYQFEDSAVWGLADQSNYVQFQLKFHVLDVDGVGTNYLDGHNLYLTNLEIVSLADAAGSSTSDLDLKKAVRVHITDGSSYNALFALGAGSDATLTTVVHGNLDLNNDGSLDQSAGYEWTGSRTTLDYGNPSHAASPAGQVAYDSAKTTNFASDTTPSAIASTAAAAPGLIGAIDSAEDGITLTVTMWLEGWTNLSTKPEGNGTTGSAVWDPATYIGKYFGVGFRFATELHANNE